jgi:hypothetical protein
MEALRACEVDMDIRNVSCSEENRTFATQFIVFRPVSIADFQETIVDELLKCGFSSFIPHSGVPLGLL